MKNLVIIIHAGAQQDLSDLLRGLQPVQGFTFTSVEGHGVQSKQDISLSARDKVVGYVPRIRVDILLEDEDVKTVLSAIRSPKNGNFSSGIYWCLDVQEFSRL